MQAKREFAPYIYQRANRNEQRAKQDTTILTLLPPRTRTPKVVLPLMSTLAFIVRGNRSHLLKKHRLMRCC